VADSDFTDLLKPHYDDGVNYCRALCSGSSKAEAEDVMQQALLKAYENIDSLRDKASFKSWFFKIITRCFYNSVRKPFWSRFVSLNSEEGKIAFQVFEDEFFEDNQILIAALSQISKEERVALLLFEIGGFSIIEITSIQNERSESTIKSRLSRARKKLKVFMEDLENEERVSTRKVHSINQKSKDLYHETTKIIKEIKSIG
jgi:RNA polymerase sigma-70 factor (ECF subfamily)